MMTNSVLVRPATKDDLPAIAPLAGQLVRMHHAFDPKRFMLIESVEEGYKRFFASQLGSDETVILIAALRDRVVGYAYGTVEPRNWNDLLDRAGALHDVFVEEAARRKGVARALVDGMVRRLASKGVPRVVLHAASANEGAQRFFASMGFRSTMVEMTRES